MSDAEEIELCASNTERLFFDRAELVARSGAGGKGAIAFCGKRPAGGSGGAGGTVSLECCSDLNTLGHLRGRFYVRAGRGNDADARASGADGTDSIVRLPPNCRVFDLDTNILVGELVRPGDRIVIANGGAGGQGNGEVWRKTRSEARGTVPPGGSERRRLMLSMILVADVGLVGHPNAGKSTLLRALTRAQPKVANYPFTTLTPNLGVCEGDTSSPMVILDIPGLLEGAHLGRGLGLEFLRHTEQCRLLLHLIDGESRDAAGDFVAINRELTLFSGDLARKPQVVVLSKADLPHVAARMPMMLDALRKVVPHNRIICISSHSRLNLEMLQIRTSALLAQLTSQKQNVQ
eukprot:CAMPEP_0119331364 /NCGR_PEP_ID=MMETSP1333-20130426/80440_1 /TAXON_ID=418940 /ORGANISM="Scyphosphaera apsteinii, Strain RCC1455" /LENGTH=348 /DNA_ID=CAMNT_0007340953 /DNA_START=107 /DNA_END=1153 /DNA_ORIENTATION=+